jgi:hypothetical protein
VTWLHDVCHTVERAAGTVRLKKVLFTTTITVDGTPHTFAVHDVRRPRQLVAWMPAELHSSRHSLRA